MVQQTPSELGTLLKRHRLAAGLTQQELAEAAGVSGRSVGDLERGVQRTPYPTTVRGLADALGLKGDERTRFLDAAFGTQSVAEPAETVSLEGSSPERQPLFAILRGRRRFLGALVLAVVLTLTALSLADLHGLRHGAPLDTLVRTIAVPRATDSIHPTSLAMALDGTTYVLDRTSAVVRVYDPAGRVQTTWGGAGSSPGRLWKPGGLALAPNHVVYVADTGNGRIEKFTDTGRLIAVWSNQYGTPGSFRPVSVAVDQQGVVNVADAGHFRVIRLDASGHLLDILGSDSLPPLPVLSAICLGPAGTLYVADSMNDVIDVYDAAGMRMSTVLNTAPDDPTSIAADGKGDVYVAYRALSAVQEFSPSGSVLHTWSGDGLRIPFGISLGPNGRLMVADLGRGAVLQLVRGRWVPLFPSPIGAADEDVARRIAVIPGGAIALAADRAARIKWILPGLTRPKEVVLGGSGTPRFVGPIGGIAAASDGILYATDYSGGAVVKVEPSGQFGGAWGSTVPSLARPEGVAIDQAGDVYVADEGDSRVQEFSPSGRPLNLFPIPQPSSTSLVGPAPYGIAVDSKGCLYVTDEINDRVVKLDPTGRVLFEWGSRGSGTMGLRAPQGIALDEKRARIYVADNGNNRVRVLSLNGGVLGAVQANRPEDIAVDASSGRVYVLDGGGRQVQEFDP